MCRHVAKAQQCVREELKVKEKTPIRSRSNVYLSVCNMSRGNLSKDIGLHNLAPIWKFICNG
jgi:hypothetical protein